MGQKREPFRTSQDFRVTVLTVCVLFVFVLALPFMFAWQEAYKPPQARVVPFTVTVDRQNKTVVENPEVEALLSSPTLSAAVGNLESIFGTFSFTLSQSSVYSSLASIGVPRFVVVYPGVRKEEVAAEFGGVLRWDKKTEAAFLDSIAGNDVELSEGTVSPGLYAIQSTATREEVHEMILNRFEAQILSRYSTSTEAVVPLQEAMTIASMIQRETADKDEMRIISGIIWNRIFSGMPLQLDATLQYAKANKAVSKRKDWWPLVYPRDKYINSPYNTYQNVGLPPAPISNPSVAAVVAALNPKKTECLFYFHDKKGDFHCTETYQEHVALLKEYYGRGR